MLHPTRKPYYIGGVWKPSIRGKNKINGKIHVNNKIKGSTRVTRGYKIIESWQ